MIIIKSGKKNWSGKEFSHLPAKCYTSFEDAVDAIKAYHFSIYDEGIGEYVYVEKNERLEFIFLSEYKLRKLFAENKVRM